MNLKNYVISLKTANDRRNHIINEFGKHGIGFEFFDAITPDLIDETCKKLNFDLSENQRLSSGEKGCFLSHVCLWQKMIDENIEYLAIFEDDVYLGENASLFLNDDGWLKGYDFIKTELFNNDLDISPSMTPTLDNRYLTVLNQPHLGTAGYIISQKTAQNLLNFIQKDSRLLPAIDHVMFENYPQLSYDIYQLRPAICIQHDQYNLFFEKKSANLVSQIRKERINHRSLQPKQKTPFYQKIIKEVLRPIKQLYSLLENIKPNNKIQIGFR